MKIRLAADLQTDSIVDGLGIRTVIWTQGCSHNCAGCHNPETHSFDGGYEVTTEEIKEQLSNLKGQDGITLSGGDPMFQALACLDIAEYAKSIGLNVWCYTGFTFEQLISSKNPNVLEFLKYIDILVDGKFILEEKSMDVVFRGSKNQRIIDVQKSLDNKETIEVEKYKVKVEEISKPNYLFI